MKKTNQNVIWVSLITLALTACGSSSDDDKKTDKDEHHHDHEFSVFVSQVNTDALSLLEEGELETLDDSAAGNGAVLTLSETGVFGAVLANNTVNFVHGLHEEEEESTEGTHDEHEEVHVLNFSLMGSQVITTGGHFAVLNSGTTTFVEYDELENDAPATEETSGLSMSQTYPALMIDEDHALVMVFDGTHAKVYEGTTEEASFACANPSSHGQMDELVVVTCDEGALAVVIEEDDATEEHTFADSRLALDGTAADYTWRAQGHVVVGFTPNAKNYAIIELDDNENLVVVKGSDTGTFAFAQNICDVQLDSESQDILIIGETGRFVALSHEGETLKSITLDESSGSACGDLVMASAAKTALVVDNKAQKGYEIDVDEDAANSNGYHIHERFNLGVTDIKDMIIFHEKDEDDHNHEH